MRTADLPNTDGAVRDAFRGAMRRFASAVAVVTGTRDGEWVGMAATSVTSLSMEPSALLVCINRVARIRAALEQGAPFVVNLLDRRHEAISAAFGGAVSAGERFSLGSWTAGASGVPALDDAIAAIECLVDAEIEYGSHTIIVGRVQSVRLSEQATPLIYLDGQYQ